RREERARLRPRRAAQARVRSRTNPRRLPSVACHRTTAAGYAMICGAGEMMTDTAGLDENDKSELLRIARATLREYLTTGFMPPGAPHRKSLLEPRGAFVTLHVGGELRGCIGRVDADTPLYLAVEQLAVAAATRAPRFEPLRAEELPETRVEVSVLSKLVDGTPEQIEI